MRRLLAAVREESFSRRVKQGSAMCAARLLNGDRMQRAAQPARLGCGMGCALLLQVLSLTLPSPGGEGTALGRLQWRLKNKEAVSVKHWRGFQSICGCKGAPNGDLRMIASRANSFPRCRGKESIFNAALDIESPSLAVLTLTQVPFMSEVKQKGPPLSGGPEIKHRKRGAASSAPESPQVIHWPRKYFSALPEYRRW